VRLDQHLVSRVRLGQDYSEESRNFSSKKTILEKTMTSISVSKVEKHFITQIKVKNTCQRDSYL